MSSLNRIVCMEKTLIIKRKIHFSDLKFPEECSLAIYLLGDTALFLKKAHE